MSQFAHQSQHQQGLQARSAVALADLPLPDGDGSMLLDSINAYLRVEEDGLDTLTEFPEGLYEREPTEKLSGASKMQEKRALSPIPAVDESPFEPVFRPFEAFPRQQEVLAQEKTFQPVIDLEGRGNYIELTFSQYNTNAALEENKESRLLSGEEPQQLTEEKIFVITSFEESEAVELEDKVVAFDGEICIFPPQIEENQQKEGNHECPSVDTKDLRVIVIEEQAATTEAISNQSINSTQIINLVPMDYLGEAQCAIEPLVEPCCLQEEQEEEKDQQVVEYMDIEFAAPSVKVPQDNYIDVDDQPQMEIPMDIESIGYSNPPQQEMPNMRIELIQQNGPSQEQQWAQEQEILDNLSAKSIIDQLNDVDVEKPQEFTFGKTEIQEVAEEGNSFDKDIMQNEIINDVDNVDYIPNQKPQAVEIPEENVNNLSLEVEHDNNFIEAMRDFEEISSIKEQSEVKANPELLLPSKSNEEVRNVEKAIVQEIVLLEHVEEQIEEKIVKPVVFVDIPDEKGPVVEEKEQERAEKVLRMNQVCSLAIGNDQMKDRSSFLMSRNSNLPRIIIQNDAYPPVSTSPAYPQENQQQSISPQQSSNLSFPTINVTFRDNQMNVNIVGPAFSYNAKNLPTKPEPILQQPEANECISCQKVEKPIELEELVEPRPSLESAMTVRREKSPSKIVTSEKEIMTDSIAREIEEIDNSIEQYELVITSSEAYLINFLQCSQALHKNFEKQVNQYVLLRFTPQPKTQLGAKLFSNGLFLIALVKLITRLSPTPFIVCYMYEYLEGAFGNSITKNGYVFKSECDKAKTSYEAALEKKFNDLIVGKASAISAQREVPVIRRNIAESAFFSIRCEKKDECSQVTPKKVVPEPIQQLAKKTSSIAVEKRIELPKQVKEEARSVSPIKHASQTKEEKNEKMDLQKDETYKQDRLKKNLEEIKAAYGSGFKKITEESQKKDIQTDAPNKFSELFQKYRKIKENTAADNSAIKHLSPVLKTEKDEGKKATKKQVVFNEEVIVSKDSVDMNESEQEPGKRRKKKKNSRSKRDSSLESPDEFVVNRRQNNSKK